MKNFLIFSLITFGLLFAGCSDTITNSTNPVQVKKEIIQLPEAEGNSVESQISASKIIHGNSGGNISMLGAYLSRRGLIAIAANLEIPEGAFKGTKMISMVADNRTASVSFNPSMKFDETLKLDLVFVGLNLTNIRSKDDVEFCYIENNGNFTPIENDGIMINPGNGLLRVKGAKIKHFSRYGFVKRN